MSTRDIYKHIYGKCQQSLLFRTMLTTVEQALEYAKQKGNDEIDNPFACANEWWSGGLDKIKQHGMRFELLRDVLQLADVLRDDYTAQFGPRLSVEGPVGASMECPHILTFNFDGDYIPLCDFELPPYLEWNDSALERASIAYKRACGWDFAPGEAGLWLCYYLITDGSGGNKGKWSYTGNLVGFAIFYDRAHDGHYTSLAHIRTASAARRRGVASALVAHAREHFKDLRSVEGPLTDDSAALFKKIWPEIFAQETA